MKKSALVSLLALALLLVAAVPGHAWSRTHVFIGVGPTWWGPPYPYWYYPPPYWYYPPPYYVYTPPPVVVQEPPVYIQSPPAVAQSYWYYCASANAYYPNVQTCPEPWVKVAPKPE